MSPPVNLHGTAIQVGRTGLLFLGPSGSGKSTLAFACLTEAKLYGLKAALVADDQVLVSRNGSDLVATCPAAIAGLLELRGSGIVRCDHIDQTALHYAVLPGSALGDDRIPPEEDKIEILEGIGLPALRILADNRWPLATLMALQHDIARA